LAKPSREKASRGYRATNPACCFLQSAGAGLAILVVFAFALGIELLTAYIKRRVTV
jgi:hypothetical protein